VGASGTVINEVLLYSLRAILGLILAQAVGVELSIINNFIWNDSFTFRQERNEPIGLNDQQQKGKLFRLSKYNLLSIGTFALNLITYTLVLSELGKAWYIVASLAAILVAFIFNYLGSSRWAWKQRSEVKALSKIGS
jgi:dolichol-phosphate mannosyltransferase